TGRYLICYVLFFSVSMLIISFDSNSFTVAFSSVAATINNIGPGLDVVGPTGNFAPFSNLSKITLSITMIAGRLEILPVLVLFSPRAWRRV
ncbi:MAG TPA: TrkH family potassium uptake protein, partial [Fastidiosipila sp.]|nr:TrkH family potassium uptake protein [Fastidiosipila sp.]